MYSSKPVDADLPDGTRISSAGGSRWSASMRTTIVTGTTRSIHCTETTKDGCTVTECVKTGDPDPTVAVFDHSAGSIHLTGGVRASTLTPAVDGTYQGEQSTKLLWNGGETITIAASGDEVPAFDATLTAPEDLVIGSLAYDHDGFVINRKSGLSLSWSGGGQATLRIFLNAHGGDRPSLRCDLPAATGHAVVPAELLAMLPTGEGDMSASVLSTTTVSAGAEWQIHISASSAAVHPNGAYFAGGVTLK